MRLAYRLAATALVYREARATRSGGCHRQSRWPTPGSLCLVLHSRVRMHHHAHTIYYTSLYSQYNYLTSGSSLLHCTYISWQQARHVRKVWTESSPQWTQVGCHKVTSSIPLLSLSHCLLPPQVLAPSVEPRPLQFNSQLTGVRSIDEELEKVITTSHHTHNHPLP